MVKNGYSRWYIFLFHRADLFINNFCLTETGWALRCSFDAHERVDDDDDVATAAAAPEASNQSFNPYLPHTNPYSYCE